jgi:hypothetical protein
MAFFAGADTQGLLPYPRFKAYVTGTSTPLAGGKLYTYLPGTTTPTSTYTTSAGDVANANPVILDANGEADVWFNGVIKLLLTGSDNATIWTKDNVRVLGGVITGIDNLVAGSITVDNITVTGTLSGAATNSSTITAFVSNWSPSDADGVYLLAAGTPVPYATQSGYAFQVIPKDGTITVARARWFAPAAAGSSEAISLYIRLNGATDYLVETISDTGYTKNFNNESLSIAVTAGDYINFKLVCPTWATNPLNVTISAVAVVE